jgi:sugar/nucleoside kinase (ribokinase family)
MSTATPAGGVLVCVGDLVEDVVVWPAAHYRHGTDNPARIVRTRGGSAANVAAFAASLDDGAAVAVRFIGRVGADRIGSALAGELTSLGVDVRVQRAGRTGSVIIIVDVTGERTMYPDRGAAAELNDVPESWLDDVAALHVPAYGFATDRSSRAVSQLLRAAHERGALTSVDASSVALLAALGPEIDRRLADVRPAVVFAGADEAGYLDVAALLRAGSTVVIKDGPRPVRLLSPGEDEVCVPVAAADQVRDTTGAGDAFAAGYLAGALRGADPIACVRLGNASAARVLANPGAG